MRNRILVTLGLGILALSFTARAAAQVDILEFLDARYEATAEIASTLWDYAEVGYQEEKSNFIINFKVTVPMAYLLYTRDGKPDHRGDL